MQNIFSLLAALSFGSIWLVTNHFLPWVSWHGEVVAFLGVLLLAWGAVTRREPGFQAHFFSWPATTVTLIALCIVATLQGLMGVISFWGDVWAGWFYVVLCVICIVLGYNFGMLREAPLKARASDEPRRRDRVAADG